LCGEGQIGIPRSNFDSTDKTHCFSTLEQPVRTDVR